MATQPSNQAGPKSPPAIWEAFKRQAMWKDGALVALFVVIVLLVFANIRLASKPPEFVVVDGATGDAVLVKSSPSTNALLAFLKERTKPPPIAIGNFARGFLHLALAVNSSTIDSSWKSMIAMTSPGLRTKLEADATRTGAIDGYKKAQRRTDLDFESLEILDSTEHLIAVRAKMKRTVSPLVDRAPTALPTASDRVQADLVLALTTPTIDKPAGLEVTEYRLAELQTVSTAVANPAAANAQPVQPAAATTPAK
jgi:hypothetical protein